MSALTIGNFDGVHLGHREILSRVKDHARKLGLPSCVLTFNPHPQEVLKKGHKQPVIHTFPERREILLQLGIDQVVEEPFVPALFHLSAADFLNSLILKRHRAEALVVGHDFAFGKNREGNLDFLSGWCRENKIQLEVVPPKSLGGIRISSSEIRKLLMDGKLSEADGMLGSPYFYRGIVEKGDQRGRKLGFPTANIRLPEKVRLPNGVYITQTLFISAVEATVTGTGTRTKQIGKPALIPSITNIGSRPTFTDQPTVLVETHLFRSATETVFPEEFYGQEIEVRFLEGLRGEKKFTSFQELQTQIQADSAKARAFFAE